MKKLISQIGLLFESVLRGILYSVFQLKLSIQDFLFYCLFYCGFYGGRLLAFLNIYREIFPSQDGVHKYSPFLFCLDVLVNKYRHSHLLSFFRPANVKLFYQFFFLPLLTFSFWLQESVFYLYDLDYVLHFSKAYYQSETLCYDYIKFR